MMNNFFKIFNVDELSRAGEITINEIKIQTPCFMPVATQASVKSLDSFELSDMGYKLILSNIYHLSARPGIDYLKKFGGLHKFMNWKGLILTDSGGYQGFSLSHRVKIKNDGIIFKSHIDGSELYFKPEQVVSYQEDIGSSIIMPLDVCLPQGASKKKLVNALDLTYEWAKITADSKASDKSMYFGIVQGGTNLELRERSAKDITSLGFDGYAYGGLSVGEEKDLMIDAQSSMYKLLPECKPRYLMGVGSPDDLVRAVGFGFDMFDCVLPTRIARNGSLFTDNGRLNIFNAQFKSKDSPIDQDCNCYSCENYSLAYIHHLFKSKELLAYRIASIHNLAYLFNLMKRMNKAIKNSYFSEFSDSFLNRYESTNSTVQKQQKENWLKSIKTK